MMETPEPVRIKAQMSPGWLVAWALPMMEP